MDRRTGVSYHVERVRARKSYLEAELILLIVIRGKIEVQMKDLRVSLSRGGILLINPGIAYEVSGAEDTLIGKCTWTVAVLTQLLKGSYAYFYCNTASGYSRWHGELRKILENLTAVYAAADHQTDSLMVGYLYKVLDCLIEHFQIKGSMPGDQGVVTDDYMPRIMQYILQNLHGEISLTALAEQMFVSASALSRVFKKRTGLYFADFVLQLRVRESMALLAETEENITQIALRVGFSGSSAFSRSFKKETGETPVEYRERIRKEEDASTKAAALEEKKIREELFASGRISEDGKIHRLVTADLSDSSPVQLRKIWSKAINIGEVHDLTKANIQKHCLYLRDHLHFQYVRVWNVFSKRLMLTKDTIRKPAYFAFEFLNWLGSAVIASGEGYILTRSGSGNYYLLCNRYMPFDAGQYPVKADDKPDLSVLHFDGEPSEVLRFRLTGIADQGYYIVKRRILSSESGSILDEWENFQFSEDLTADDLRYLRERCIPKIQMQRQYVGASEELSFDVEMRPEDVVLLHIYRE